MTLGLVALFLPRLELDHLQEWIVYHLNLGITKIFLYDNGPMSHDPLFGSRQGDTIWQKKPEANYHRALSDVEIECRIRSLTDAFGPVVSRVAWQPDSQRPSFRDCQRMAINHELKRQSQLREVDWLGHLDIDELLVPAKCLSEALQSFSPDVQGLRLAQKLFEFRFRDGQSLRYAELTRTWGILPFNCKWILRVGSASRWLGPHQVRCLAGKTVAVPPEILRFHHFRGIQHHGPHVTRAWGIHRYRELPDRPGELDDLHVRK
jgi:hypothetical protein